ncbi:hypothetical protein E2562_012938 [Oryza meyeriana var. granulata]|uniref:Uncharacterized protein n=1 Tax=Oryza meyeriana var. granulata TaxID=110450 RepID=A0A6G1DIJ4_9ORYZ|nr:hypothetical protein E2562_012938 [Oryza meyeriana var. granulata]
MLSRLESTVVGERTELDWERKALLEESERPEATWKLFDTRLRAARMVHKTLGSIEHEQTALDEACRKAVTE